MFWHKQVCRVNIIRQMGAVKNFWSPLGEGGGRISKNAERYHLENLLTKPCVKYEPSMMNRLLKKSITVLLKSVEEAEAECNTFQPNLRKLKSPYLRNQIEF